MRPKLLLGALLGVLLLVGVLGKGRSGVLVQRFGGAERADAAAGASQLPTAGDTFEPELGLPATDVVAFGSSTDEAPGETWAYGKLQDAPTLINGQSYSDQYALLQRTDAVGWQVMPLPPAAAGGPLAGAPYANGTPAEYGALAGQSTAAGGVVLLSGQNLVLRDPGSQPQLVPAPAAESPAAMLLAGESLLPPSGSRTGITVPYAALEDSAGHTGILIAPDHDGGLQSTNPGVLHYDSEGWTREAIELPPAYKEGFKALALACGGTSAAPQSSSPENCWLLASAKTTASSGASSALLLFRRSPSTEHAGRVWKQQEVSDWLLGSATPPAGVNEVSVAALPAGAQMLTATSQGVWVDFQTSINGAQPAVDATELVLPPATSAQSGAGARATVAGSWCYPVASYCQNTLAAPFPSEYRSFAWEGSTPDPGTRIITGLGDRAMLELAGGSFSYVVGAGGAAGPAAGAAAFSRSPQGSLQGSIADGTDPTRGADGQGQSQVVHVTPSPAGDQLGEESVPFRRPLLAVAQAPGSAPGSPAAAAIAAGEQGQIARYLPGQGWRPEALYDSAGHTQTPTLRGVAWPTPGRVYAVGDGGAMWLWRAETGLWEPDPAKPLNFIGNLSAIAFSSTNPDRGYAVGRQGVLLSFGKTWSQVSLPAGLQQANFTSVAFAGSEAIATYRTLGPGEQEIGGVLVENGSGWQVDASASALLATLPSTADTVLSRVAGLPDGGAVAAGPGMVIERDSPSSPWRWSTEPLPEAQNVSALAAYREASGPVRAIISIDLDQYLNPERYDGGLENSPFKGDVPPQSGAGEPPAFLAPDLLPNSGYLLKETAGGWSDMEHQALPVPGGGLPADMPTRPDPVLALLADSAGDSGLAVGGETGDFEGQGANPELHLRDSQYQTAAAMRFPAAAAAVNGSSPAPVLTTPGNASFVVAGGGSCVRACGDFVNDGLGPEVWLSHALGSAAQIATTSQGGLRAFLYTDPGGEEVFVRALSHYGGALPVYAPGSGQGFTGANPYYSFISNGPTGGPVLVIVLSVPSATAGPEQEEWLRGQLQAAHAQGMAAVVMGEAPLGGNATMSSILVGGGASAYFFCSPEVNERTTLSSGGLSIPAYGTCTMGYVSPPGRFEADALGSSGFLLAEVDTSARNSSTNIAPVTAKVVPNIAQLALDATDGVLLRRSQVALFEGLARRPDGGAAVSGAANGVEPIGPDPYDPIPFNCQGPNCAFQVPTDYTFTSSNPDIGDFVAHDPTSSNPRQVKLGLDGLPVADPTSGLFCAFNPGTTTVSITAGGLTYSEPVTVQGGSVEYPCGTVPLRNPPTKSAEQSGFKAPELPASSPAAAGPQLQALVPPAPPHLTKPHVSHPHPVIAPLAFLPPALAPVAPRPAIVPPPAPPVGRPIPPSGSSQVYQSMGAPEEKREEESATELASSSFAAYDANSRGGPGSWVLLLVLLAAGAGVGIRRGGRVRSRDRAVLAYSDVRARAKLQ